MSIRTSRESKCCALMKAICWPCGRYIATNREKFHSLSLSLHGCWQRKTAVVPTAVDPFLTDSTAGRGTTQHWPFLRLWAPDCYPTPDITSAWLHGHWERGGKMRTWYSDEYKGNWKKKKKFRGNRPRILFIYFFIPYFIPGRFLLANNNNEE